MTKKTPVRKLADKTILQKVKPTTEEHKYYRCDVDGIEFSEDQLQSVDSHINANPDHAFRVHTEREAIIMEDD